MEKRNMYIAVAIGIVVVAIFAFLGFFSGVGGVQKQVVDDTATGASASAQEFLSKIMSDGRVTSFSVVDVVEGTGAEVSASDTVTVHYIGSLPDGTVFDSSHSRGMPAVFNLGEGQLIQGFMMGLSGMKVGGTRIIAIPPELGYGERSVGAIPQNASLIFQVELLTIAPPTI